MLMQPPLNHSQIPFVFLAQSAMACLLYTLVALLPARGAEVEFAFRHTVSGESLRLDSLRYRKSGDETFSVSRLSYLLSKLAFEKADGTWVESDLDAAWIDAGKHRTSFRTGIPEGEYRAVRFSIGLGQKENLSDPASHAAGHASQSRSEQSALELARRIHLPGAGRSLQKGESPSRVSTSLCSLAELHGNQSPAQAQAHLKGTDHDRLRSRLAAWCATRIDLL